MQGVKVKHLFLPPFFRRIKVLRAGGRKGPLPKSKEGFRSAGSFAGSKELPLLFSAFGSRLVAKANLIPLPFLGNEMKDG